MYVVSNILAHTHSKKPCPATPRAWVFCTSVHDPPPPLSDLPMLEKNDPPSKISTDLYPLKNSMPTYARRGCHPVREKQKIFSQGKVREFYKKSGKISVLVKVSEKSVNCLQFRVKSQGIFWNSGNSGNSRDFQGIHRILTASHLKYLAFKIL